ncbi:hypothetical protein V8G54_035260 [Vigna mungo]|uniref:Leucine-rich repeat-containing N-terminal plant-type domain-containing protein n=1 Tax=Vigna mungo TaxID=3915 RepID=A0AAQ3MEP5_VIGMU
MLNRARDQRSRPTTVEKRASRGDVTEGSRRELTEAFSWETSLEGIKNREIKGLKERIEVRRLKGVIRCNFDTRCNQQDMDGLLNFKQGVTYPSAVLSSWTTQLDCCHWKGVICSNITSRVTGITLLCPTTPPIYNDNVDKSHCLTSSIHLSLLFVELEFLEYLEFEKQ